MPNNKKVEEMQEATSAHQKTNSEKQEQNAEAARRGSNSKDEAKKHKEVEQD